MPEDLWRPGVEAMVDATVPSKCVGCVLLAR